MALVSVSFYSYEESIPKALDQLDVKHTLGTQSKILIKPNLVNSSPHPVTTPAACCEAIIKYIQAYSDAEILIAEGCGDMSLDTDEIFRRHNYHKLAKKYDIELLDLNYAPLRHLTKPECPVFPEIYLPEVAFSHFIISVPVLKAHCFSDITGTLKNMMGFAPPEHYSGRGGSWKKAVFHQRMHESIIDLNRYRTPDLSIMDASIGLSDFHLGGPQCSPPVKKILAGFDSLEIDREAARLLGMDWRTIPHLKD
jgi:uncharacterized protein (DUF362 family)